jgi:hypothetical protein
MVDSNWRAGGVSLAHLPANALQSHFLAIITLIENIDSVAQAKSVKLANLERVPIVIVKL